MVFTGISKTFSTCNGEQYLTIGSFWDEISKEYGRDNLQGLGYNWTENKIEYVIGLKNGEIEGANCKVILPDEGWQTVTGKTADLGRLYEEVYKSGNLKYEIEMFDDSGNCRVKYLR